MASFVFWRGVGLTPVGEREAVIANAGVRRLPLITGICLMAGVMSAAASPAASLRDAMEEAVRTLLADLFVERPAGHVVSIQGSGELIVRFPGPVPPTDAEYLLVRPAGPGRDAFAQTVGGARIAEIRGEMARAVALWGQGNLRPGDEVVWPPRFTVLLLRTEAGDSPELADFARHLDRWLELELLADRRLRVVRADQPAEERWRVKRFQEDHEYALVVAPLLVADDSDGVEVILRVRSMFTGQTLAQRGAAWKRVARPAPPPPAVQAPLAAARPPSVPHGPAIRPVQPEPPIKRVERNRDRMSVEIGHPLKAIALADVDGDGRVEVVGITDRQVIVYRWTGQGLTVLTADEPLRDAFMTYLHVDAGDVIGKGKAAIVVAAVRTEPRGSRLENEMSSAIAELGRGRLEYLARGLDRHLRVLHVPGKAAVLVSQAMGLYEPFEGPLKVLEWKDGRVQAGAISPLSRAVSSVYGFASGTLDGDGKAALALVAPNGQVQVLDTEGKLLWESEEDLGEMDTRGFAQTPRFPDYRGRTFDASPQQTAVWRTVPRRVLVAPVPATTPDIVTLGNGRLSGVRVSFSTREEQSVKGRAVGYGWDAQIRQFAKRWESADFTGRALDFALADLDGDGRIKLVVLSGVGDRRFLDVFTLYDRSQAADNARGEVNTAGR